MHRPLISSPSNDTVKNLIRLKDRKGEWAEKSFLVEGYRELSRALQCGFTIEQLFVCPKLFRDNISALIGSTSPRETELSREAFAKIATREDSDGVLGVLTMPAISLKDIGPFVNSDSPLIVAVENIEKPGNLGAILRTADAAKVDAVITLNKTVDPWNQHVIRASLGGVFSIPVVSLSRQEFMSWCAEMKISIAAAALTEKSQSLYEVDLTGPTALVFGTEAHGLSKELVAAADVVVRIPMAGVCDSLNVSVAAAVCIFEAVRQRHPATT